VLAAAHARAGRLVAEPATAVATGVARRAGQGAGALATVADAAAAIAVVEAGAGVVDAAAGAGIVATEPAAAVSPAGAVLTRREAAAVDATAVGVAAPTGAADTTVLARGIARDGIAAAGGWVADLTLTADDEIANTAQRNTVETRRIADRPSRAGVG
jgi:hypothetical protein